MHEYLGANYSSTVSLGAVSLYGSSLRYRVGMTVNLTNFQCYGNESHLLNCSHRVTSSCNRNDVAGVLCYGDVVSGS